jgi:hypothetical protein
VPNVPGHLMSDEPYTLTETQIDALNSMPPGIYFVCSGCRRFKPVPVTVTFKSMTEMVCEACA